MIFVVPILLLAALLYLSYRAAAFALEELPRWSAPALLLAKLLFGFALWAVYTFYYHDRINSDIYKYFDDATILNRAFLENKSAFACLITGREDSSTVQYTSQMHNWERNFNKAVPFNENQFMIRLNALMMLVSFGNIHVHTIFFCFLSFLGSILLLHVFQYFLPEGKKKRALATMLFPSFLFWTSGGLKESLIVLGLGLFLYGFIFLRPLQLKGIAALLSGLLLLLFTKYFLLVCMLPALTAYHLFPKQTSFQIMALKYAAVLGMVLLLLALIAPVDKRVNFARIISKKQKYAIAEAKYMKAGSYSEVPLVDSTLSSVAVNLPAGLWNSMIKPYLWQSRNPMILLSAAENVVILFLLVLSLFYRERKDAFNFNMLFFFCLAVLLYFSIIGVMTPVLGNLVRYKVVLLPMLIFLLVYIAEAPVWPLKRKG